MYEGKQLDYIEKYETVIPLNLFNRKLASDTFNNIISNNANLLLFLKQNEKILKNLDYPDVEYLLQNKVIHSIDSLKFTDDIFDFSLNKTYKLMQYISQYENMRITLFLFKAEIVVFNLNNHKSQEDCCGFQITDGIICHPNKLRKINNCQRLTLINLKIVK